MHSGQRLRNAHPELLPGADALQNHVDVAIHYLHPSVMKFRFGSERQWENQAPLYVRIADFHYLPAATFFLTSTIGYDGFPFINISSVINAVLRAYQWFPTNPLWMISSDWFKNFLICRNKLFPKITHRIKLYSFFSWLCRANLPLFLDFRISFCFLIFLPSQSPPPNC